MRFHAGAFPVYIVSNILLTYGGQLSTLRSTGSFLKICIFFSVQVILEKLLIEFIDDRLARGEIFKLNISQLIEILESVLFIFIFHWLVVLQGCVAAKYFLIILNCSSISVK